MELLLILFVCFLILSCIMAAVQTMLNLLILLLPFAGIAGLLILNARIWAWKEQVKVEIRKKNLELDASENRIRAEPDHREFLTEHTGLPAKWK